MTGKRVNITLNGNELWVLEQLRDQGIYGRTVPEVIRRLLDRQLEQYCQKPMFDLEEEA